MHETLGTQVDGSPQKGFKMVCTQCKNMIISISQTELRVEKKIKTKNGQKSNFVFWVGCDQLKHL